MDVIILINCRKGPGVRWSIIRELSPYGAIGANEVLREDEESAWLRLTFRWAEQAFVGQAAGVLSHIPGILEIQEEAAPVVVPAPVPLAAKPRIPIGSIAIGAAICALAGFAYISIPKLTPNEPASQQEVAAPVGPKAEVAVPTPVPAEQPPVAEQLPVAEPPKPEPRSATPIPVTAPPTPPPPAERAEAVVAKAPARVFNPSPTQRDPETPVIAAPPAMQAQAETLPAMNLDQAFPAAAPKRQEPPAPAIAAISAPRPLKRVEPVVNSALKSSLKGDIIVAVRVYVGANGQVLSTVPMKQNDAKAGQLAAIAADTIKRWQFEPATQNGKPMAGETIVRLRF
jgi:protein TonB